MDIQKNQKKGGGVGPSFDFCMFSWLVWRLMLFHLRWVKRVDSCVFAMEIIQKQHVASLRLTAKSPQWLEDEFPFEKVYF